jgi:8-oxo-dGTP diphosphatase
VISALRQLETVPLILVRHASAGRKADWSGDDCLRPLDAAGVAAARVLASLMACFAPVARVISSPALRCTDTVRPYAAGSGGTVETEPCLAPYGRSADFSSRTDWLPSGACSLPLPSAVPRSARTGELPMCSPKPALLTRPPRSDPSLPKGGFCAAHTTEGSWGRGPA